MSIILFIIGLIVTALGLYGFFWLPIVFGDSRAMWIFIVLIGLFILFSQILNKFKNKKGIKK